MTIQEFSIVTGKQIQILFPDAGFNFYASFPHLEFKTDGGGTLHSPVGRGETPGLAVVDLCRQLEDYDIAVSGGLSGERVENNLPKILVYEGRD